jgi:hypothetical protein
VRKDKISRLERATRAGREQQVLKEVFLNHMAQVRALADGKEPPPTHPRAAELARGTFFDGPPVIKGGGTGPVPDLSEDPSEG